MRKRHHNFCGKFELVILLHLYLFLLFQIQKRRSSLKMRLSSVNSTPDKTRREMELKEKTQIMGMAPTEKDDQIKLAEKLDTDSQHKALNMSSQQQQTFDSMDLPKNLTEVLEAQENNTSSSKIKVL